MLQVILVIFLQKHKTFNILSMCFLNLGVFLVCKDQFYFLDYKLSLILFHYLSSTIIFSINLVSLCFISCLISDTKMFDCQFNISFAQLILLTEYNVAQTLRWNFYIPCSSVHASLLFANMAVGLLYLFAGGDMGTTFGIALVQQIFSFC